MSKNPKYVPKIALFLLVALAVAAWADVKLRIYLQDGTLQAGNLVSETADSFVVLAKDGRVEIKKDKIMFINGKTLKQWEERPDKLFSTEIIPSEIPDPAYVNNKSAAPQIKPVSSLKSVMPSPVSAAKTVVPSVEPAAVTPPAISGPKSSAANGASSAAATPASAASASSSGNASAPSPASTSGPVSSAATPAAGASKSASSSAASSGASAASGSTSASPAGAGSAGPAAGAVAAVAPLPSLSAITQTKAASAADAKTAEPVKTAAAPRHRRRHNAADKTKPAAAPQPEKETASASSKTSVKDAASASNATAKAVPVKPARAGKFNRAEDAAFHFQKAQVLIEQGLRGPAIQELHIASTMDRGNVEAVRMLGQYYKDAGVREKATKYFSSPLLRKDASAKAMVEEIANEAKHAQRSRYVWMGGAGAGAFAWVPLLFLMRMKKKKPSAKTKVVTAETIESFFAEKTAPAAAVPETSPNVSAMEQVVADALKMAKPEAPTEPAFTGFQKPPMTKEPPKPMTPAAVPPTPLAKPPTAVPNMPPPMKVILPEPMPVGQVPPVVPITPPAAPAEPVLVQGGQTPDDALRFARLVEAAVRKGNSLAMEEKFDLARREYRTALMLNPGCTDAYIGLGYLCFLQGQWELALQHYTRCLDIDPNSADAHYGIGRVLLETDRINEAVSEFRTTLSLDPSFEDARESLTAIGTAI